MKLIKPMPFLLSLCFSFSCYIWAEDYRIEQIIAKNIDGRASNFSFVYKNSSNSTVSLDAFLVNAHQLSFSTDKRTFDLGNYEYPTRHYSVVPGVYFINYDFFSSSLMTSHLQKEKKPMVLSWNMRYKRDYYSSQICLAWSTDSPMDIFLKKKQNGIYAEIIKLMDGNNLSFALLVANHTSKKFVLTDLYGDRNQVRLKFPNGRIFTPPLKKDAKNMELNPGENKTFKIELDQLLKENKDFSMKDFEYGLTELVWEIKPDKEQTVAHNFWLVKFNGELPKADEGTGYTLDGPLTLETFRDNKISALSAAKTSPRNRNKKDIESETKETAGNKESSQK